VAMTRAGIAATCVGTLLLYGCVSCGASAATTRSPASPSRSLNARQICGSAAADRETVVAAHLTTVNQVRTHRGGPRPGYSPAEQSWAHMPGDAVAAWCVFKSGSHYIITAAIQGASVVTFMISATMFDPGSEGPPIP
jgi:hypothetical protein